MKKVRAPARRPDQLRRGKTPKMACPKCNGTATLVPDGRGGMVYRCNTCGRMFSSS